MDWITGIQRALDYIEDHICEDIDYEELGRISYSSPYHFQRVFSILCGYTLGEYIRLRRLTLAGRELAEGNTKVIEAAMEYGYDSPDSFAKAFAKFHGITPSAAREPGARLKSFSRLSVKVSLEGGSTTEHRIVKSPAMTLVGIRRRFTGTPDGDERWMQEHIFACESRLEQYLLHGMAGDCFTTYEVVQNIGPDGYDFCYAAKVDYWDVCREDLGPEAERFEEIEIPPQTYLVCETPRCQWPCDLQDELRYRVVTQWLPGSGYRLAQAPELAIVHWPFEKGNEAAAHSHYVELWLPVEAAT
ncbi:MAG: helix-turn-helix domain-containing protein [Eubacteriales bacterium]|nr:helix-turn-helix domain-containing protein [Eubacteriales bacterium]